MFGTLWASGVVRPAINRDTAGAPYPAESCSLLTNPPLTNTVTRDEPKLSAAAHRPLECCAVGAAAPDSRLAGCEHISLYAGRGRQVLSTGTAAGEIDGYVRTPAWAAQTAAHSKSLAPYPSEDSGDWEWGTPARGKCGFRP
jgi:hypothetical protein